MALDALVGVTSLVSNVSWFKVFGLQNAARVNALGKGELIFSMAGPDFPVHDRPCLRERPGVPTLTVSILLLILVRRRRRGCRD